jgi:hypothetical protein
MINRKPDCGGHNGGKFSDKISGKTEIVAFSQKLTITL